MNLKWIPFFDTPCIMQIFLNAVVFTTKVHLNVQRMYLTSARLGSEDKSHINVIKKLIYVLLCNLYLTCLYQSVTSLHSATWLRFHR